MNHAMTAGKVVMIEETTIVVMIAVMTIVAIMHEDTVTIVMTGMPMDTATVIMAGMPTGTITAMIAITGNIVTTHATVHTTTDITPVCTSAVYT